ncbi:MAG: helix-turn-helix domain-containing protein [Firmicutes bacterium]|nr:helix-turn-helix domain-containing protein [Bacillota bacterium]
MLNENIKAIRRSKGISQDELAVKLNVVRQTVSKWERGLSVPDSDMLIDISEILEVPVSTLLGETVTEESRPEDIKELSEKLEAVNLQLARQKAARQKRLHRAFIILCAVIVIVFGLLWLEGGSYMDWDYADPEKAVMGTIMHAFVFVFVRLAPFAFIGSIVGAVLTRKRS